MEVTEPTAETVLVGLAAVAAVGCAVTWIRGALARSAVARKRQKKYEETRRNISKMEEYLATLTIKNERVAYITGLPTSELLSQLQEGDIKPVEALHAFQIKTVEAQKRTNAVVEFITEAEEWARQLEENTEKGPLYGLPICVKDDCGVVGYDMVIGCACFIGQPAEKDAIAMTVMQQQGAVPFVKTNVPQTKDSYESTNPVYGTTVNPWDPTRGCGGSSGGTGALIAAGGAHVGIGGDTGGSIRCPAHMNGVCGFKQTGGRHSTKNRVVSKPGAKFLTSVLGPMAKDMDGLVAAIRSFCAPSMFALDRDLPPVPFNEQEYADRKPLRIGYFTYNEYFRALPPCERAVHVAKEALEQLGHTLVPFTMPRADSELHNGFIYVIVGDGAKAYNRTLKHDKRDLTALGIVGFMVQFPAWVTRMAACVMQYFDPRLSQIMRACIAIRNVDDYWKKAGEIETAREAFCDEWKTQQLDAVISPAFGVMPMPIGNINTLFVASSYTVPWNVLNYPSGVLPVTRVTDADKAALTDYPTNTWTNRRAKESMRNIGTLPVGVQVTTLPWTDELCLRIMKQVEEQVKFKPDLI